MGIDSVKNDELPGDFLAAFAPTAPGLSGGLAKRVLHSNSELSENIRPTVEGQRQTTSVPYETGIETVRSTGSRNEAVTRYVDKVRKMKQNHRVPMDDSSQEEAVSARAPVTEG